MNDDLLRYFWILVLLELAAKETRILLHYHDVETARPQSEVCYDRLLLSAITGAIKIVEPKNKFKIIRTMAIPACRFLLLPPVRTLSGSGRTSRQRLHVILVSRGTPFPCHSESTPTKGGPLLEYRSTSCHLMMDPSI